MIILPCIPINWRIKMSDFDLELNAFLFGMECKCKGISTQTGVEYVEYKDTELEVIFLNGYNFE